MYNILNAANVARTEAVKRKTTVSLCSSDDIVSCAGTADTWTTGWIVFEDVNGNGDYDAADDTIILSGGEAGYLITIKATSGSLMYETDGTTDTITRFAICDDRLESSGRQINVMNVGRANLETGTSGTPISDCTTPS